jgi:hypothetical protein
MRSFAAWFAGTIDSAEAGADSDSVAGELSGDGPNGTMDGAACVRRTSSRPIPQLRQKFACLRLNAWQRGHCIGNLTPHTSQK